MTADLEPLILAQLREQTELLRRIAAAVETRATPPGPADADRWAELVEALRDRYAGTPGAITAAGLLALADDDPHSPIACALAAAIDLGAAGRAVTLGRLLARLPDLELDGERRGAAAYRVRE
jgi:hypothetical protein